MSASDREEVFRSTNVGLRETTQNQLAAHQDINQRAIDLVKVDLLGASIVVSVVSLIDVQGLVPYSAASLAAFLYSVWASVRVFRPRHVSRGLGAPETQRIRRVVGDGLPPDAHHEQLTVSYREAVVHNSSAYLAEARLFGRAVWSSVAAVLFATAAGVAVQFPIPAYVTGFVYVTVPVACLWAKNRYGYDQEVET